MKTETNILRLNLNDYIHGTPAQKKAFSEAIGKAYTETGFVTITNHGMTQEQINALYAEAKNFFDQPDEFKLQYQDQGIYKQRGYIGKEIETAKGANKPDLKEFWQLGQVVTDNDPIGNEYLKNIEVPEFPKFNTITREAYQYLEKTGIYLLRAIAVYLGLPEHYFDEKVHNGNSILRALHYFPIQDPDSLPHDSVRAGAHEDINLITLLIGASADGLELLTRDGEWFPVKAHVEDIVVNVGDMLQRLTNNKLKSTTHRVINPPKELMKTSRYSVPFFLHPKGSMNLACLESCINSEYPKAYEDITAGEYLDERLYEIGLKGM